MIVTITGNNSYSMKQKLDELVSGFVKTNSDLALERFDGEEIEPGAILEAVQAAPFLSSRKMVVVRNGSANNELPTLIEQIISSASDATDLIFYEPLTDKRTIYYKTLKSKTTLEEYLELDTPALANWLVQSANKSGASLSLSDANYMVQRSGHNQQLLASELVKLATYNSDITRQNIDLLTEPTPQSKIFDLLDAAFDGNKQKALALYADQRAQKIEPGYILAMIAWQLDILTVCKLAGNKPASQIAQETGISSFPVQRASSLASRITNEKLKELVSGALEIDYKSKSREYNLDEALKTYIVAA